MVTSKDVIVISIFALISVIYIIYNFEQFADIEIGAKFPDIRFWVFSNLCPNLKRRDLISSFGILNTKIAIVIAVQNKKDYEDYLPAINTTHCYAKHFGYQMHFINMTDDAKIKQNCNHTDVFFKRHCALATFMEDNTDTIEYVLYLDADMGVINPCHTIQEYLDKNKNVHLTFYERYYDHEIAAGSYLVRNSAYSRKFLRFWADYFFRLPKSFHGTDNGAIHEVFMELHFPDKESQMQCYHLWNTSKNYGDLFAFQACTKYALYSSSKNTSYFVNDTVKLIPKMSPGWVRDGWLTGTKWSSQDFMFHGWKKSKLGGEWKWPFSNQSNFGDLGQCKFGDREFQNFKYLSSFSTFNQEITEILGKKVKAVEKDYENILNRIHPMCKQPCAASTPANQ